MIFIPNFVFNHDKPDLETLSKPPYPTDTPLIYGEVLDYYFDLAEKAYQGITKEEWKMARAIPNLWLRARWLMSLFFFGSHIEPVYILDMLISQQVAFVKTHSHETISQFYCYCLPYGHSNIGQITDNHLLLVKCISDIANESPDTRDQFSVIFVDADHGEFVEIIQIIAQDKMTDEKYTDMSNRIYKIWNEHSGSNNKMKINRQIVGIPDQISMSIH